MPIDPKYASLPWIAVDEPDVYESGDLPESDQRKVDIEDEQVLPKEIEKVSLSAKDAQKRFINCKVNATAVDFSGNISGSGAVGYTVDSSEYICVPGVAVENETMTQRYQRLQREVRLLIDDSEAVVAESKLSDTAETLGADELMKLASSLRDQLSTLQLEEIFGPDADIDLSGQEILLQKRIVEQINRFKPSEKRVEGKPIESLTYELFEKPSQKLEHQSAKTHDLDRRLQRLEALLGQPDPSRLSALTADTMGHGLLEAANRLAARSALLQPCHLDQIETRLSALQTKLQGITEKREAIADADSQHKIAELYELVKKWDSVATEVPQIVGRLQDLQLLHEQAAEFSSSLAHMEFEQQQINQSLESYSKLLQQVQASIGDAMNTFKENISVIEERMKKISK